MRTMIVEIQVEDDADPTHVHEQANAMFNPRDEEETEAVVWDDATAFIEGNKVLARLVLAPVPTSTYAFGGRECCEESPGYRITRTNSLGTDVLMACSDHVQQAVASNAMYVAGWGTVTTTVERIE